MEKRLLYFAIVISLMFSGKLSVSAQRSVEAPNFYSGSPSRQINTRFLQQIRGFKAADIERMEFFDDRLVLDREATPYCVKNKTLVAEFLRELQNASEWSNTPFSSPPDREAQGENVLRIVFTDKSKPYKVYYPLVYVHSTITAALQKILLRLMQVQFDEMRAFLTSHRKSVAAMSLEAFREKSTFVNVEKASSQLQKSSPDLMFNLLASSFPATLIIELKDHEIKRFPLQLKPLPDTEPGDKEITQENVMFEAYGIDSEVPSQVQEAYYRIVLKPRK